MGQGDQIAKAAQTIDPGQTDRLAPVQGDKIGDGVPTGIAMKHKAVGIPAALCVDPVTAIRAKDVIHPATPGACRRPKAQPQATPTMRPCWSSATFNRLGE